MADSYDFIDATEDIEIYGTSLTNPIMRVTALAKPSGVVWVTTIPTKDYNPTLVSQALTRQAGVLNAAAEHRSVVGLSTLQDVDRNNQLIDLAIVTLESSSGRSTRDYRASYAILEPGIFDSWVADRVAALDAVENA